MLADVLRRLAPRWLATSRCVCRAWRATVDSRGLLSAAAGLLPHSLAGIFLHHSNTWLTSFLARPSAGTAVSADLHYTFSGGDDDDKLYDSFQGSPTTCKNLDPALEELEWPPSPCVLHVFSSRTGRWEERSFARQGLAAGTVADMRVDRYDGHRYAVYWRGALYVQCQTDFIMRFSLSSGKYQVIQPPVAFQPYDGFNESFAARLSIGKSDKGVYSVLVEHSQIKVWILNDSDGQIKWVPKQMVGRLPKLQDGSFYYLESHGPWVLQDINCDDTSVQAATEQFEWDSDDDNLLPDNGNSTGYKRFITFLGFHPYKEVIFLNDSFVRVLAYHLNSSKIQDLGYVYEKAEVHYLGNELVSVERSFPYTPCWMTDFPQND
ncbi:unnamed protein product [Urochloa decumbens]|uniref:F-box domain-containing protein n=1 Tax=Urochloa decumbens TaxID=240449 RepID=A0ABC8YIB9_9POAL